MPRSAAGSDWKIFCRIITRNRPGLLMRISDFNNFPAPAGS